MRTGILAAGNWIIDIVKIIDSWPSQESLVNILFQSKCNGGSPYNVLKDLANLKAPFPLQAAGLVGADEQGNYILQDCHQSGIGTDLLVKTNQMPTSYTDVMTVKSDGKRTFFHNRGANALLSEAHIKLELSQAKIFQLGYLLLLDNLDLVDANGLTGAARLFKQAKEKGFITATDIVSENSDRFKTVIPPSLPYVDYLFVNEYEAAKITDIKTSEGHDVLVDGCVAAAKKLIEMGVQQCVILHFPKGAIAVRKNGEIFKQGSIDLPKEKIAGSVGAGDAFAAGVLMGIHENFTMQDTLKLGVCTAAASLFQPGTSEGVKPWKECLSLGDLYQFREI